MDKKRRISLSEALDAMDCIADTQPGDPHDGNAYWAVICDELTRLRVAMKKISETTCRVDITALGCPHCIARLALTEDESLE